MLSWYGGKYNTIDIYYGDFMKMRALIAQDIQKIELTEVEKPTPKPDEVLVKVHYAGICGTDFAIYSGDTDFVRDGHIKYPVRFGHEWSGVVCEVGDDVTEFSVGDHVVSDSGVSCNVCEYCQEKKYDHCLNIKSVGTINCHDGAFADYMLMPQRHLFKLPKSISLKNAAMIEPSSIAYAGFIPEVVRESKSVLIIGTGSIAIAAIPLAKALGIKKVMLSGRNDFKLDVAKKMGADVVIDCKSRSVGDAVREHTDGIGADLVIECSGNISTIDDAVDAVRPGGFISLIGFYERLLNNFKIDNFVMKAATIKGVMGKLGSPRDVIALMDRHDIDLTPLITRECTLEQAADIIAEKDGVDTRRIKVMITINE